MDIQKNLKDDTFLFFDEEHSALILLVSKHNPRPHVGLSEHFIWSAAMFGYEQNQRWEHSKKNYFEIIKICLGQCY